MNEPVFNFQHISAWLSFLCFLGTAFALFGSSILAVLLVLIRRRRWAIWLATGAITWAGLYGVILMGFSFVSREQILSPGQEKYFCEGDCHLAYSVLGIATAQRLGTPPHEVVARGKFYVVRVETWFDERTISPQRPKDMPLTRGPRLVEVVDDTGRRFELSREGEEELAQHPSLSGPLTPGQSTVTELVFDLPGDLNNPRLVIVDTDPITYFLIGNENSFGHAKTTFRLEPAAYLQLLGKETK